jgi:hypothetical protein
MRVTLEQGRAELARLARHWAELEQGTGYKQGYRLTTLQMGRKTVHLASPDLNGAIVVKTLSQMG